jgi:hypothetical protein
MDGWLFWFRTRGFVDDAASIAARVNENIGGEALAGWLSGALRDKGIDASEPWAEDHGYDFSIAAGGRKYLCVCHIEEEGAEERDGAVSLTQIRSMKDRLFGANKVDAGDPLGDTVYQQLAQHAEVSVLRRE